MRAGLKRPVDILAPSWLDNQVPVRGLWSQEVLLPENRPPTHPIMSKRPMSPDSKNPWKKNYNQYSDEILTAFLDEHHRNKQSLEARLTAITEILADRRMERSAAASKASSHEPPARLHLTPRDSRPLTPREPEWKRSVAEQKDKPDDTQLTDEHLQSAPRACYNWDNTWWKCLACDKFADIGHVQTKAHKSAVVTWVTANADSLDEHGDWKRSDSARTWGIKPGDNRTSKWQWQSSDGA